MSIDPRVQRAYSTILQHFIDHGRAPHFTWLAKDLGVDVDEARRLQREALAAGRGAWLLGDTDYIESFAPFYNAATQVAVSVDGEQKWFAQCGLEALSIRWIYPGREVRIDAACFDCAEPIVLRFRDEEILEVNPETTVGHMNYPLNAEARVEPLTKSFF
jgi:hypothetical protein